ncbi:MAG: AAA family ATPase [Bacteroidota bacterium]
MPKPSELIASYFPHQPTEGQQKLFSLFDLFLAQEAAQKTVILLKGYAGTGKTSVVSALVKALPEFDLKLMLLAPTGRAAKVMAGYSERSAFTIHKIIYQRVADPVTGKLQFSRRKNYQKNTLFVVDEASMLSNDVGASRNGLLSDLIDYVYEQPTNRLMLIGDSAQLPPVGQTLSQGLDAEHLEHFYRLNIFETELTEVMRQEQDSGILHNATQLRQQLLLEAFNIQMKTQGYTDVYQMQGRRLEDGLRYAYDKFGRENTAVICRSNKAAVNYNRFVRHQIFFYENELEVGDYLMIVKNNYFFTEENSEISFLANGDFIEILKVFSIEEKYDLRFADLELQLLDYPDQPPFEAKVMLDVLHSPSVALEEEKYHTLYQEVLEEYQEQETRREQVEAARNDEYLNALQVKYAYALTCHKSQGGQWDAVFVDQGYLPDERLNTEYLRWLYTAVTRARQELFLMNFREEFFET